jgi:hypothetical protein
MKTIYLLILVCIFSCNHLLGRIRNGYEPKLQSSKISLQHLYLMLEDAGLSFTKRLQIKSEIENMVRHISYHALTEVLIRQLKIESPDIYAELDNIKDKRGRSTDIYVRVIPKDKSRIQLKAASFFQQAPMDEDASVSDYGEYSVSVDIWAVDNALYLMSHELGHVKYIVPNLATYVKYYKRKYARLKHDASFIGHNWSDPSGKYADAFAKRFLHDEEIYLKNGGRKLEAPRLLLTRFKRNTKNLESLDPTIASKLPL